jgi:hypothetical protein
VCGYCPLLNVLCYNPVIICIEVINWSYMWTGFSKHTILHTHLWFQRVFGGSEQIEILVLIDITDSLSSDAKSVYVVCCILNSDSCLIIKLCSTQFCLQCKWNLKLLYCCSLHNCEFHEHLNVKCLSSIHLSQNFPKSFSKVLFGLREN